MTISYTCSVVYEQNHHVYHVYPVWLVNFYSPKRYLLHVKKVKTVKNIDMKTLIFLKFTFRGLLVYRDRGIWF